MKTLLIFTTKFIKLYGTTTLRWCGIPRKGYKSISVKNSIYNVISSKAVEKGKSVSELVEEILLDFLAGGKHD
jgi:hypothetical protein